MRLSLLEIRAQRLARSGLHTPFATASLAAHALVGIQAQILNAAGLALRNRVAASSASPLTEASLGELLYRDRTLIKLWGQRGTLHLYRREDWPLIGGAYSERKSWWRRQAEKRGKTGERYREAIATASRLLHERGTLGRSDLRESGIKFPPDFLSSWGGIFFDLVYQGDACHCEPMGTEGRFAGRRHWLPELEWSPPDVDSANLEIARRYFHAYGPASLNDLAYWRGVRVGEAAAWIKRLGKELVSVRAAHSKGAKEMELWMPAEPLRAASTRQGKSRSKSRGTGVRLLGRFDPLLLAHRDKSWIVPDEFYSRVWRPMGHIEGTMIQLETSKGALGTWRYDRSSKGLIVEIRPFEPLAPELRPAFEREAQGVADYFSLPLERVRFKTAVRKPRSACPSPPRREAPSPPRSSRS